MSAALKQPPDYLPAVEFLAWDGGDRSGRLWQLRDGTLEAMAPASDDHAAIQFQLGALIAAHLL